MPERQTHDYVRHGTTTLFAASEIATGRVEQACLPRHRHQEFLTFLKQVAKSYLSIITRQAIRRGSFGSVTELIIAITSFIDGWNERSHPFVWTKPADDLLDHCRPGQRTSFTRH